MWQRFLYLANERQARERPGRERQDAHVTGRTRHRVPDRRDIETPMTRVDGGTSAEHPATRVR